MHREWSDLGRCEASWVTGAQSEWMGRKATSSEVTSVTQEIWAQ